MSLKANTTEQLRSVEGLAKRLNDAPKAEYLPGKSPANILKIKPDPKQGIFRPNPSRYLNPDFVKAHLKQFDEGMVKITSYSPNKEFNSGLLGCAREGSQEFTTFVMTKTLVKDMTSATNGNSDILEELLDFSRGAFEVFWQPGGKTWLGGIPEGVIDAPKWGDYHEISTEDLLEGK